MEKIIKSHFFLPQNIFFCIYIVVNRSMFYYTLQRPKQYIFNDIKIKMNKFTNYNNIKIFMVFILLSDYFL